ncbi:MerR family transcriptional regulator [Sphingomonas sp. PL20]|jgi:DNA-binding transcriptional MerR regulator|uniref:MerR family transcriptional regulator n=2 Tax=Pseudomonadota TaxID=1224 RepID=UPI001AE49F64
MSRLRIGELADAAGVRKDTIRYYERTGLLPAPQRTSAGYRVYHPSDVDRIKFVRTAQGLGYTLTETQALLLVRAGDILGGSQILAVTRLKLREAQARVEQLERIETRLAQLGEAPAHETESDTCPLLFLVRDGRLSPLAAEQQEQISVGEDHTTSTGKD